MRVFRRALTVLVTLTTSAAVLTGCSSEGDAGTVNFGYIADYNGASLLAIAENQGLWEKQGLEPEVKEFTNGPLQIQALGAGDLDFGYIGPGAFWLPASGKAKVAAINTLTWADRVISQPGIDTIEQLKGKKVGVPEGTSGQMVLDLALEKAGMSEKDIQKVPMEPSTVVSAFNSGQIDAAGIWYPLIGSSIKPKVPGMHELASTKDFESEMSFPTAFVSGNNVDKGLSDKVVTVLQQANDWRVEHKQESIQQAAELLDRGEEEVAADAENVELMSTEDLVAKTEDGSVDKWLNGLADMFVQFGKLDSRPEPGKYYDAEAYTGAAAQ